MGKTISKSFTLFLHLLMNGNLTMFDFNAYTYWDVAMAKERKKNGEGALMSVPPGFSKKNNTSTVNERAVGTLAEYNAAVLANLWLVIGSKYE